MYVPSVNDRNWESWRLLVKECIANIGKLKTLFLKQILLCSFLTFWVFGSLQTSLLCTVVELAEWGSVAVGISDRLKVTFDMWHVTCDMGYVTCDMWHVTCDLWYVACDMWHATCHMWHITIFCGDCGFSILLLLPAHVEWFSVSRMQDFCRYAFILYSIVTCDLLFIVRLK